MFVSETSFAWVYVHKNAVTTVPVVYRQIDKFKLLLLLLYHMRIPLAVSSFQRRFLTIFKTAANLRFKVKNRNSYGRA